MESSQKVKKRNLISYTTGSSSQDEDLLSEETIPAEANKCCSGCKTTKTPLWRSGPSGPKSLCNACGIKYRKKRHTHSAAKNDAKKGKIGKTKSSKLREALKANLMHLRNEVEEMEEQRSPLKKQKSPREWGEVERAALLLMALSCGAVFA